MKFKPVIAFCLLLQACSWFEASNSQEDAVARVGNFYLYQANLTGLVPEGSSLDDSTELVRAYIDNWIREHLIITEAEERLSMAQKDFSQKLEDYRRSLLRYRFENEVLASAMDTSIDQNLVETYYYANKEQFLLRRPVIQGRFVKLERMAPRQEQLKKWLVSKRSKDLKELEEYCFQYAFSSQLPDSVWLFTDELFKGMAAETQQAFQFNRLNELQSVEDSSFRYYLYLKAYRPAGAVSPLSFEEQNIVSLILLQRRQEHISRYYEDLYRKARAEKKFEIYEPD
jgi:hypothetical protein